ncbi:MAG: hypothetical protein ACKV2T_00735 [Kofleriaceae bacterium]
MIGLTLAIDRVVVQTNIEREAAARLPETLRVAFLMLAEKWGRSPWVRRVPLEAIVREHLEISVSAEELLGERGAERLAETMWTAFLATVEAP